MKKLLLSILLFMSLMPIFVNAETCTICGKKMLMNII